MKKWLLEQGADKKLTDQESYMILNEERMNKTKFKAFNIYRYNKYDSTESLLKELNLSMTYSTTGILTANTLL